MATKIPLGTSAYYTSFQTGQGAGVDDYFEYDEHLDVDFLLLRLTINTIIDEISALSGPNAVTALDLVLWDDADGPIGGEQNEGVVGAASYEVSIEGGSATLQVKKGQVFVAGQRASLVSTMTGVAGVGGGPTNWVAIDVNGAVFIETAAGQKALDIASVPWNGSVFASPVTHLADVFFDGDSWAELRNREAAGGGFPAVVYRRASERLEFIEQSLSAAAGGASLIALPPGAVGAPGLVFSDGAGAADTTTGWYRLAANVWAYAVSGVQKLQLVAQGIAGVVGAVGSPTFSFVGRLTTGLYSPAADVAGLAGGGELAVAAGKLTAGGVGLPNLLRCQASNVGSAHGLTDATWEAIDLDASPDIFDVGGWHDPLGANPDRFTVPTNGDGVYRVNAHALFDDPVSPTGDRGVRVTLNGTAIPATQVVIQSTAGVDTCIVTLGVVELVATDIVRVEAYEDHPAVTIDVTCTLTIVRAA